MYKYLFLVSLSMSIPEKSSCYTNFAQLTWKITVLDEKPNLYFVTMHCLIIKIIISINKYGIPGLVILNTYLKLQKFLLLLVSYHSMLVYKYKVHNIRLHQ